MKIRAARWYPTSSGNNFDEPASGTRPSDVNGIENFAVGEAMTMSQCNNIVVPTPTALPFTAAISGLGNSSSAPKKRATSEDSSVGGFAMKSLMSFPAVKCSPSLVRTTARTPKSPAASLSALARPAYMSRVRAFIFSGRLNLISRVCPCLAVVISVIRAS